MGHTERVVLFSHPNPIYRRKAEASLDELQHASNLGKDVYPHVIETHPTGEGNLCLVREHVLAGDTIGLIGGDGTWRLFHQDIIKTARQGSDGDKAYIKSIESVSIDGGNGGDITRAQHGRLGKAYTRPSTKIKNGVRVAAHSLEVRAVLLGGDGAEPGMPVVEDAFSYVGFGKMALASEQLASDAYRNGLRYYRDLKLGLGGVFTPTTFTMADAHGARSVSDLTFAKGHCIGKVGCLPIEHWEPGMVISETAPGIATNVLAAASLMIGHGIGRHSDEPYSFMPISPVLMHLDGDRPRMIQPETSVTVAASEATYNMLVTRRTHAVDAAFPDYGGSSTGMHYWRYHG